MSSERKMLEKAFRHGYTVGYADAYFAYKYPHETANRMRYIKTAGITMPAPSSAMVKDAWMREGHKDPEGNLFFPLNVF